MFRTLAAASVDPGSGTYDSAGFPARRKKMNNAQFMKAVKECFGNLTENKVFLPEEAVEVPVLQEPLVGFASADDPLFDSYSDPQIIGPDFRKPCEWMPEARSVAVFFFPFTDEIRTRHGESAGPVDEAWNIGYGNHQKIVDAFVNSLASVLSEQGISSLAPAKDKSFRITSIPVMSGDEEDTHYSVSWSNRHAGFVAGLGTFGIHRHLITEKGCCGGFGSLILDCELSPTERRYKEVYEYCIKCGACTERCPVSAITLEHFRNLKKCSAYAGQVRETYGGMCGRCLAGIPCAHKIPSETLTVQQ